MDFIMDVLTLLHDRADFFMNLVFQHLQISLIAILIATILGLLLGIWISEHQKSSNIVIGIVNFIYTIPSISLLGFLIPFSGIGNTTVIIALVVYALLPMVRNTHTGITNINPAIIEAAKGMGSTKMQILWKIKLPLALPTIMSGFRNMVVMTIALTGIASFIGAGGLGVAIYRGITTNNAVMTFAGSLLIALLAFFMDFIFGRLEKALTARRPNAKRKVFMEIASAAVVIVLVFAMLFSNLFTKSDKVIHLATKPMTEQMIIGEALKMLIEQESDLTVEITEGVGGGTSNIQPAMEKGEFDIYPEYTGTGWNAVLKEKSIYHESMFKELQDKYKEAYDFSWVSGYGFNNTYGIAVAKDIAQTYNIKTYSDLAKYTPQLTFGAEYDFYEREDGYEALQSAYAFNFKETVDLDIGLKYQSIQQGDVDVIVVFTTDGQLNDDRIVILEDDKNFFPSYMAYNVVRNETLKEYPELADILDQLENKISDSTMARLNYEVEVNKKEPKQVAKEFLDELGLLEE